MAAFTVAPGAEPAEPVRAQLQPLQRETQDDLATVVRGMNVEREWAADVSLDSITEVDLPHVQCICEGLHWTPHELWGADQGPSMVDGYGPDLWPRYIEHLFPPPPDLDGSGIEGPDLGP